MADAKGGDWHREQVIKACRVWLESGAVVEDCLSAVVEAGHREFNDVIHIVSPAVLRIGGFAYQWPADG